MMETGSLLEWIANTISTLGYWGIGLLMFAENVFPPIPSEVIMPLAGFTATQGKLNINYVILAGMIGSVLGTLPWYYAGKYLGTRRLKRLANRYGKWFTLSGRDIDLANRWFYKYGGRAMFFGRLLPAVRSLISVPAGISRMPLLPFLLFSTAGTGLWVSILTLAGYILGQNYSLVEKILGPVSGLVTVALLVAFSLWFMNRKRNKG